MSNLYFKYGVMGAGKTARAIMQAYDYIKKGMVVSVFKCVVQDDIDENNVFLNSRLNISGNNLKIKAHPFNKNTDLNRILELEGKPNVIIVDEAQFLNRSQVEMLDSIRVKYNIDIYCYGLKTDFKRELFEGTARLIELADEIEEIKSKCHCGKNATSNARVVNGKMVVEGEKISVGGDELYIALCNDCYNNRNIKEYKKI